MKRWGCALLSAALAFSLAGCDIYQEADMQFTVASLGFESGKEMTVYAEVIVVDPGDSQRQTTTQFIRGSGENVKEAVKDLRIKAAKPLMFCHCGLICLDDTLEKEELKEILEYCYSNKQINYTVYFVNTADVSALLQSDAGTDTATGYNILGKIRQAETNECINFGDLFYEIMAEMTGSESVFSLPVFEVEENEARLAGAAVYENGEYTAYIGEEDLFVYSLLRNYAKKGDLTFDGREYDIKHVSTSYGFDFADRLAVEVRVTVRQDKETSLDRELSRQCLSFMEKTRREYKTDIFGFGNKISKMYPKLWETIHDRYQELYADCEVKVRVKE